MRYTCSTIIFYYSNPWFSKNQIDSSAKKMYVGREARPFFTFYWILIYCKLFHLTLSQQVSQKFLLWITIVENGTKFLKMNLLFWRKTELLQKEMICKPNFIVWKAKKKKISNKDFFFRLFNRWLQIFLHHMSNCSGLFFSTLSNTLTITILNWK